MSVTRYHSVDEMPRPWRQPDDPGNLRVVAQMMAFYRSLVRSAPRRASVQRFRTMKEAHASDHDPYRR